MFCVNHYCRSRFADSASPRRAVQLIPPRAQRRSQGGTARKNQSVADRFPRRACARRSRSELEPSVVRTSGWRDDAVTPRPGTSPRSATRGEGPVAFLPRIVHDHLPASLNRPRRSFVVGALQPMSLPPSSAPTATGWSNSCRAGFTPAEKWRLVTAHRKARFSDSPPRSGCHAAALWRPVARLAASRSAAGLRFTPFTFSIYRRR